MWLENLYLLFMGGLPASFDRFTYLIFTYISEPKLFTGLFYAPSSSLMAVLRSPPKASKLGRTPLSANPAPLMCHHKRCHLSFAQSS